jgi:hypothetical protein
MKDPSSFNKESCINEISRINSEVNLSGVDLVCLLIYFFLNSFCLHGLIVIFSFILQNIDEFPNCEG